LRDDDQQTHDALRDPVVVLQEIYPALLAMARSLVGPSAAEDLVQEALVQVLARYPRFEGLVSPLAYTKTALARLAYRSWRSPELPSELPDLLADEHGEAFTEDVVLRRIVLAALDELPKRQRACVYLRFIEGLSDQEIGAVLGCRPSTVRSQTARALKSLRPVLLSQGVHGV
jgi:RNA polymerase sigma factor (sigma-70 family)